MRPGGGQCKRPPRRGRVRELGLAGEELQGRGDTLSPLCRGPEQRLRSGEGACSHLPQRGF